MMKVYINITYTGSKCGVHGGLTLADDLPSVSQAARSGMVCVLAAGAILYVEHVMDPSQAGTTAWS
jgi:hypothetical protein